MPRKHFSTADMERKSERISDKLIILSCEGVITEEEYFEILSKYFVKASIFTFSLCKKSLKYPPESQWVFILFFIEFSRLNTYININLVFEAYFLKYNMWQINKKISCEVNTLAMQRKL